MNRDSKQSDKRMPTLFLSHGGGPWPFMEWGDHNNPYAKLTAYLQKWPNTLPQRPKALLVISGHWEEEQFTVMTHPHPPMLYDYYGFPEHTYHVQYKAPGSPELARRVRDLLAAADITSREDSERGFDHGVFTPFAVSHPQADVPIVQLSMLRNYDPQLHLDLGRALAPLRDEGVMIVGSGLSYHNLRMMNRQAGPISRAFDSWLTSAICESDSNIRDERLKHWAEAPGARFAHPREDHLIPLMVVAGAAGEDQGVKTYSDEFMGVEVSGFQFG